MALGMFFEDFQVNDEFISGRRTVTETDIVLFAGLSGDYNPLHTDETFAQSTPFKTRIAHGVLGTAIATGLQNQMGIFEGTTIALMEIGLKFTGAIIPGDTIYIKLVIKDKKETSKSDRGIINLVIYVTNQNEKVVQELTQAVMLKSKAK
ncbi:MAG: MaoC/PaaZ C-terminal domain-containing protein [Desulfitobacteriaceae bacterium]